MKVCEMGSMVLTPYPKRLEDVITKAVLSSELFEKILNVILREWKTLSGFQPAISRMVVR